MTHEGGTALDAALQFNIPGVCVECGQHDHPDAVARGCAVISKFLLLQAKHAATGHYYDCQETTGATNSLESTMPLVMKCIKYERVHEGFQWIEKFEEFSKIHYGDPVFKDNVRGQVSCPFEQGAHIVMPAGRSTFLGRASKTRE
jgi:hypothetical protein